MTTLDVALAYIKAGISVVPIPADGSKKPIIKWGPYQKRIASEEQAMTWFGNGPAGIATLGGRVSGNLEQIDFDTKSSEIFPLWCELVEAESAGLLARLCVVKTPRTNGGYHVRYRCSGVVIPGNTKLAMDPEAAGKAQTLIETRGEGGYALAPGSAPECHENNAPYEHVSGPKVTQVEDITPEERDVLIRNAVSFNLEEDAEGTPPQDF